MLTGNSDKICAAMELLSELNRLIVVQYGLFFNKLTV
jgi:hypothetical protein